LKPKRGQTILTLQVRANGRGGGEADNTAQILPRPAITKMVTHFFFLSHIGYYIYWEYWYFVYAVFFVGVKENPLKRNR